MTMSKSKRLLIRLLLIVMAAGCFIGTYLFFENAMSYMGEMFDTLPPSSKMMGPKMMRISMTLLIGGIICLAILIATLFIKAPADRSLDQGNRTINRNRP